MHHIRKANEAKKYNFVSDCRLIPVTNLIEIDSLDYRVSVCVCVVGAVSNNTARKQTLQPSCYRVHDSRQKDTTIP